MEKVTKQELVEALSLGQRAFNKFSERLYFSNGWGGRFDMHHKVTPEAFDYLLEQGTQHENGHVRALAATMAHSRYEWDRSDNLVVLNENGEVNTEFQPWEPPKELAATALANEMAVEYPNHTVLNAWIQMASELPSKLVSKIVRGAPTSARIALAENERIPLTEKQYEWNAKNKDERLASAYISRMKHNPSEGFFEKIRFHTDKVRIAVYCNPHIHMTDEQIKKGLTDTYRTFNGMIDSYDYMWCGRFLLNNRPEIRERTDLILDTLRNTKSWESLRGFAEEFELKISDVKNINGPELAIQYERKLLNERTTPAVTNKTKLDAL